MSTNATSPDAPVTDPSPDETPDTVGSGAPAAERSEGTAPYWVREPTADQRPTGAAAPATESSPDAALPVDAPSDAATTPASTGDTVPGAPAAAPTGRTSTVQAGRTRRRLGRGPAVVLVAALVGAVVGGLGSLLAGPTYSSTAAVLYNPAGVQYIDDTVNADPNLLERQVTDQVDVVYSDAVMDTAADTLGVDPQDLRDEVDVEVATGSSLISITGQGDSAAAASDTALAVTDAYVGYLRSNGVDVLNQRADVLQGTIDRQTAQLATLDQQLTELNDQLGGLNPQSAAYGAVQGRIDRLATQIEDLTTRSADLVDQQETLRANAAIYPGEAFPLQQPATPKGPSSLSPPKAAAVGAALGLVVGGCALAFLTSRGRGTRARGSTHAAS